MKKINPYINFNGNTEEAFLFYKSVFGGEFAAFSRFKDTQAGDNLPEEDKEKIMHVSLPLENGTILMATDVLASMGHQPVSGNNFSLSIECDSKEEANTLFDKLAQNGSVTMPLMDTFWGAYFGMLTDQFGIQWMLNVEK